MVFRARICIFRPRNNLNQCDRICRETLNASTGICLPSRSSPLNKICITLISWEDMLRANTRNRRFSDTFPEDKTNISGFGYCDFRRFRLVSSCAFACSCVDLLDRPIRNAAIYGKKVWFFTQYFFSVST